MIRRLLMALVIVAAASSAAMADEIAFVWLKDGRMLAGRIDAQTNDDRLWLRASSTSFVLRTSAAWTNIDAASVAGKKLSGDELKRRADELKSAVPADHLQLARPVVNEPVTNLPRPFLQRADAMRVASLEIEAHLANWDRDAEVDGIEIQVVPRNVFGEVASASGQLLVELTGRKRVPIRDRLAFPQLGRWSLRIDASDFAAGGAVYRLPFSNSRPDEQAALELHGLVEATFVVFGQGRFDAEAPVYLHRFNPVRDDLRRRGS